MAYRGSSRSSASSSALASSGRELPEQRESTRVGPNGGGAPYLGLAHGGRARWPAAAAGTHPRAQAPPDPGGQVDEPRLVTLRCDLGQRLGVVGANQPCHQSQPVRGRRREGPRHGQVDAAHTGRHLGGSSRRRWGSVAVEIRGRAREVRSAVHENEPIAAQLVADELRGDPRDPVEVTAPGGIGEVEDGNGVDTRAAHRTIHQRRQGRHVGTDPDAGQAGQRGTARGAPPASAAKDGPLGCNAGKEFADALGTLGGLGGESTAKDLEQAPRNGSRQLELRGPGAGDRRPRSPPPPVVCRSASRRR